MRSAGKMDEMKAMARPMEATGRSEAGGKEQGEAWEAAGAAEFQEEPEEERKAEEKKGGVRPAAGADDRRRASAAFRQYRDPAPKA